MFQAKVLLIIVQTFQVVTLYMPIIDMIYSKQLVIGLIVFLFKFGSWD